LICIILCKMKCERKSEKEAKALGAWIRSLRELQGKTIEDLQESTSVNVGQISRFEAGKFVFVTENLQRIISILQQGSVSPGRHPQLLHRFEEVLDKSPRHQAAAVALLGALEALE
jgi:transcriptional regulator with XRE-family HTH domain